jgi:hypothetical protein
MSPECQEEVGEEFMNAGFAQKVKLIEAAIGRVAYSQEHDVQGNRNRRALLSELKEIHLYFLELAKYAISPSAIYRMTFLRG